MRDTKWTHAYMQSSVTQKVMYRYIRWSLGIEVKKILEYLFHLISILCHFHCLEEQCLLVNGEHLLWCTSHAPLQNQGIIVDAIVDQQGPLIIALALPCWNKSVTEVSFHYTQKHANFSFVYVEHFERTFLALTGLTTEWLSGVHTVAERAISNIGFSDATS